MYVVTSILYFLYEEVIEHYLRYIIGYIMETKVNAYINYCFLDLIIGQVMETKVNAYIIIAFAIFHLTARRRISSISPD